MNPNRVMLRPSVDADLPTITAIYAHHVLRGTASFEIDAPDLAEMARRRDDVLAKGLPWIVAQSAQGVLGYAYANHFRLRPAYRYTLEDSIYIDDAARGRGVGRLLLAELIARCATTGARQMLAVIGDAAANAPSSALHGALGFKDCGVLTGVGWKFDAWRDVKLMQRALARGATRAPT